MQVDVKRLWSRIILVIHSYYLQTKPRQQSHFGVLCRLDSRNTKVTQSIAMLTNLDYRQGVLDGFGQIETVSIGSLVIALRRALQPLHQQLHTGQDSGWIFVRFKALNINPAEILNRRSLVFGLAALSTKIHYFISTFNFGVRQKLCSIDAFFAKTALASRETLLTLASIDQLKTAVCEQVAAYGRDPSTYPEAG